MNPELERVYDELGTGFHTTDRSRVNPYKPYVLWALQEYRCLGTHFCAHFPRWSAAAKSVHPR